MKWLRTYGCFAGCLLFMLVSCSGQPKYKLIDREQEKVELGKRLFNDVRLSSNNNVSCATCHQIPKAFTDGLKVSVGVDGRHAFRNSPSLYNVKFQKRFMADGEITSLETQLMSPLLDHAEMNADLPELFRKLKPDRYYQSKAQAIYHRPFDVYVLTRSIAAYERTLISLNSRYDQFRKGKIRLTRQEQQGYELFTQKLYCIQCHQPPYFTNGKTANNGLYKDYGKDEGRYRVTHDPEDKGKFKIPSLRNVALTAPYMHDGSMTTLLQVIRHYEKGGNHPTNQSALIQPFRLSKEEETNLVLFLKTLSDNSLVTDH